MMIERVKKTIKKYGLLRKNDTVVVGVSGGPDSVALLYVLNSLGAEFKIKLHIAHLDHCLRKGSVKDREFVQAIAERLKLPVTYAEINVKRSALKGSVEEAARHVRLAFFFKVARDIKADKIALGHNQDDQAETVLMRILRGTGLFGLSGILPKRDIAGYTLIRPLIEVKRKDIEAFLRRKNIAWRVDHSNLEDVYFRNKLRNKLIPLLEREYNGNIKTVLCNTAESAGYDYDYLHKTAQRISSRISIGARGAKAVKIDLKKLSGLHPAIQRLILRINIAKLKGNTRAIDFKHIKELVDLLLNRPVNSVVDLPKGISVIKKNKVIVFYRNK